MPTYLERYQNGDCVQVWEELIALGEGIRQAPICEDAQAVARETMLRTRRNIETLYQRLTSIGYQFLAEPVKTDEIPPDPLEQIREQLAKGSLMDTPLSGLFANVEAFRKQVAELRGPENSKSQPQRGSFVPLPHDVTHHIEEFEALIGKLPLSIRAWGELVGHVDFAGQYPGLSSTEHKPLPTSDIRDTIRRMLRQDPELVELFKNTDDEQLETLNQQHNLFPGFSMAMTRLIRAEIAAGTFAEAAQLPHHNPPQWYSDPLHFDITLDANQAHVLIEHREDNPPEDIEDADKFEMIVGADSSQKAGSSGGAYHILLPDARADTMLYHTDLYFVAYLRDSFRWGGFPDLKHNDQRDDALLAYLKEGLEPI